MQKAGTEGAGTTIHTLVRSHRHSRRKVREARRILVGRRPVQISPTVPELPVLEPGLLMERERGVQVLELVLPMGHGREVQVLVLPMVGGRPVQDLGRMEDHLDRQVQDRTPLTGARRMVRGQRVLERTQLTGLVDWSPTTRKDNIPCL